jgi:hypothetical protein
MKFAFALSVVLLAALTSVSAFSPLFDRLNLAAGEEAIDASVSVRNTLFNKIFADAVPILNLFGAKFPVPGVTEKHFKFDAFNLTHFHISSAMVDFSSPSTMTLTLNDVGLDIPSVDFEVMDTVIVPIKCKGQFWGNISSTTIAMAIDLTVNSNGSLWVSSVTPSVNFGSLQVNHTIDGTFCNDLQSIIRDFIGSLNKLIEKLVSKDLPSKLAGLIESEANKELPKLPIKFVSQPLVVNDTLGLDANIGPLLHSNGVSYRTPQNYIRDTVFTNRDLSLSMGHNSVDKLLAMEFAKNHVASNHTLPATVNTSLLRSLFPIIYRRCPDCPLSLDIVPTMAPVASMINGFLNLNLSNLVVGINAVNVSDNTYNDRIFDLGFNLTLQVYDMYIDNLNEHLYFHINVPQFAFDVYHSSIGPINVSELEKPLAYIIESVLVPIFNMNFKGVKIPLVKDGVGLQDVEFEFGADTLTIGANLKLPKL